MCVTGILNYNIDVHAEDIVETDVAFEELLTDDALVGYAVSQTRGAYLANGYSTINDAGGGQIGVGGITIAAYRCKVSVNAVVERLVNGSWVRVTSFSRTNTNALSASVSKYVLVGSGYYYRVRSTHCASSDTSTSCTSSLWM